MPRRLLPVLIAALTPFAGLSAADALLSLTKGDRVAIMGSGVADRLQHDGWLETLIQHAFPTHELTIRNIAYSCDDVVVRIQTDTGATRDEWLAKLKTDVVLAFYGFNEDAGGHLQWRQAAARGTVSPLAHEKHTDPNDADPTANNGRCRRQSAQGHRRQGQFLPGRRLDEGTHDPRLGDVESQVRLEASGFRLEASGFRQITQLRR